MNSETSGSKKKGRGWLILGGLLGLAFIGGVLTAYHSLLSTWYPEELLEKRGQFGDSFGALNACISSLAFIAVSVAVYLQRQDLNAQRAEAKESAAAVSTQVEVARLSAQLAVLPSLIDQQTARTIHHSDRTEFERLGLRLHERQLSSIAAIQQSLEEARRVLAGHNSPIMQELPKMIEDLRRYHSDQARLYARLAELTREKSTEPLRGGAG